ncbi:aldolase [Comamonas endophytica]|uniref:3-oxo-tetronate 4-phosphate decarboxylase n=1 Tax=Comamonas endophytica TaxID=2949090 RepID=A0ABY6GE52_9BURK|nr:MULTISPECIES: aldolase [unclassified Acidovorax]MCD2513275.1 aldolase [Acidovorax sp. D4N7]UYG53382.1 aldolase [Acidovorax sp. 5MLIR]
MTAAFGDEVRLREEICEVGASLHARGYTTGTAGNISARLEDGWLITPTDACLGTLDPARLAKVSAANEWVSGDKPSKTLALHRGIYERNAKARCVLHTHSTHLVALTLAGVASPEAVLPPITPYQVMKIGRVPLIPYARPGAPSVAEQVAALAPEVRGVLLERLGPVVWAPSVTHAAHALEELEETARLWLMLNPRPAPLAQEQVAELESTFNVRW